MQPIRRSEQLECVAREADRLIRHGFDLAGRKSYFAARAEFIKALRLIAQGLDTEHHTPSHSRALAVALTAIEEAEDFLPKGSRLEGNLDLADLVRSHRTPVLKDADAGNLTPMVALQWYFTFAQEQLAAAAGGEVAGSIALHALGKLHGTLAAQRSNYVRAAEPKGMVFYQAALLVYPGNHMAANDLGVLLAGGGNYRAAESVLKRSLAIQSQPTTWHNLATVHQRLGQVQLARQARAQSTRAHRADAARRKALPNVSDRPVRWVDSGAFARANRETHPTPQSIHPTRPPSPKTPPQTPSQSVAMPKQPGPATNTAASRWLPWIWGDEKRN